MPVASATSVHPQETTASFSFELSYRDRLLRPMRAEYDATEKVYQHLDGREHKFRTSELRNCRTDAWLAVKRSDRRVIVLATSCQLRWCPICSKVKATRIAEGVTRWLRKHPHPKLLTLTLKHSADTLDQQITRLYACFRNLRQTKYIRKKIRGGVWFFQVKWSKKLQQWHPHLHCLLDAEYMPHDILLKHWLRITGDSTIIDIRVIRKASVAAEHVARYATRPAILSSMPEPQRIELVDALHGRRLHGRWGTGNEIKYEKPDPLADKDVVRVSRFENITSHCVESDYARAIWRAYKRDEPLPLCWNLDWLDRYSTSAAVTIEARPEPPPKQLMFFHPNAY